MTLPSDTWGRMDYAEAFSLLTYSTLVRFSMTIRGERRHADGRIRVGSLAAHRAACVVWADRAETVFDLEIRQVMP
ncbi:hypothetical protein LGM57_10695 [Burkholderia cepacia]|uniref:hypothetical protein n=1 Tax=Burkholderia cepacia TaxID=292 RepID=UPI001CF42D9F|nr:hypothetical protein [Burkholderia cepacia]MCA7976788.1 hypothetical protein [Burkholderia cepacia]